MNDVLKAVRMDCEVIELMERLTNRDKAHIAPLLPTAGDRLSSRVL